MLFFRRTKSSYLQSHIFFVYNIKFDVFYSKVVIWDTRNFEKPIVTLTQAAKVIHLEWSPNRAGLLCSAVENSTKLTIHDIQSWPVMSELGEPAVTERNVKGI